MKSKYYESFEYDIHHSDSGREIQDKYDILEEIYRSEQSVLNKIIDKHSGMIYVLKGIMKKKGLIFEVDMIKKISSSRINKIVETYESEHYIYLIEEFVEGMNLEQHVKTKGVFEEKEAKRVIREIAMALNDLHGHKESKYVFRDLKPSNIMIKPGGEILLIDVITIREVKENQTQDTFLIGSKGYTAPEAYGFMQTTEKSDIYSLGATLFFILTGIQPANISSFSELLSERKEIKGYLKSIIYKSTAFMPEERFVTVKEFIRAIEDEKLKMSSIKKRNILIGFTLLLIMILAYNRIILNETANAEAAQSEQTSDVLKYDPYTIENVISKDEFKVDDLERLDQGIQFVLYDTNVLRIQFDRTILSDAVSNFAYISVGTSSFPLQMEQWSRDIYEGLVNGDGYQAYVEQGFLSQLDDRNHLYIVLYDINKEPIAYYSSDDVRKGLQVVPFEEKSESFPEVGIYEFEEGIYFEYFEDFAVLHVDKDKVPYFSNVGIWSKPTPITQDDVISIQNAIGKGKGVKPYLPDGTETGYGDSGSFMGDYWIVYLLDDENDIVKEYRSEK